jgi:glucose/arabinose dehydrogenase
VGRARFLFLVTLLLSSSLVVLAPSPVEAAGQISVYRSGLNWPIALGFAPDGRIFFAERLTGNIRIIENGSLLPTPFYTLTGTETSGERGLLGLALDPEFDATPYVYAYQTYDDVTNGTIYNRIVRILANANTGLPHTVILRMPPLSAATNHNGGVIGFGPDGKLYAVVGENAIPSLSQDPMSPMGKVLRMNPNGSAPPDNPFYGNTSWHNLTYTYGHRNMFGLAFHPFADRIYVTENGPNCNDELNNLTAGGNFGWGPAAFCAASPPPPNDTNRDGPNPILPIWWWRSTICPTNIAAYGGPYFPAWQGDLFMGDCNFRRLHRLDVSAPGYDVVGSDTILWTAPPADGAILDVEEGPDGAIWVTTVTTIYRYWDSAAPPIASFIATPNPTTVGTPVIFDASASYDPDGMIDSYAWDFGDMTTGGGPTPSHVYSSLGTYNVSLTVTDNESYAVTTYREVDVQPPPPGPQAPVARFLVSPSPVNPGAPVSFNASTSYDLDGSITSYAWEFGDGLGGTGIQVSHAYVAKGVFRVRLTVVDDSGLSNETSSPIEVRNRGPVITANAPPAGLLTLVAGETLTFSVTASDPDADALTYMWRIDGAAAGTTTSLNFTATTPATYTVNVTVSDGTSSSSRQWTVTVVARESPSWISSWATVAIAVAVVLGALVLLWQVRRRQRPKAPPPSR